jgi:choline dehydrogenase-like flavoprotein
MISTEANQTLFDRAKVIVVGTGFAGLALATKLNERKIPTLLIEGGALRETERARQLTITNDFGIAGWSNHWIRAFGGTSSRWSGYIASHDRPFLDLPNHEAARWLGQPESIVDYREPWLGEFDFRPIWVMEPTRLASWAEVIERAEYIDLLLEHNVTHLDTQGGSVTKVRMTTLRGGKRSAVVDKPIVLAAGGLGNAQILLQSIDNPFVGKFLMEHPHIYHAAEGFIHPGLLRQTRLAGTDVLMNGDLACLLSIGTIPPTPDLERYNRRLRKQFVAFSLTVRAEQEPRESNRAELSESQDWAGNRRLDVHCHYSSRDLQNVDDTIVRLGETLAMHDMGSLRINKGLEMFTGGHIMGTTAIGKVVDERLKVMGYDNLFVCGSSVFPRGGAANPTFTIVALALRLGDYLAAS